MTTNPYFGQYSYANTQGLMDDLSVEMIQIAGIDVAYMPRRLTNEDALFNEDDLPLFDTIYPIEVYVKDVEGFQGQGDFLSKFGLQIDDTVTFSLNKSRFTTEIGTPENISRPYEGDLIYFPFNQKVFKISHVEHESIFYQFGQILVFDLRCDLFKFSNERFQTGNTTIDTLFSSYVTTTNSAIANIDSVDLISDNSPIETYADGILDFTPNNPFGNENY